jgi:hypothetical protein
MSTSSREPRRDAAQARRRLRPQEMSPWSSCQPAHLLSRCASASMEGSGSRGQLSSFSPPSVRGPGASQSAGGLAERHALPVGAQPRLAPVAPADALEVGVEARPVLVVVARGGTFVNYWSKLMKCAHTTLDDSSSCFFWLLTYCLLTMRS